MAESNAHFQLVQRLITFIDSEYGSLSEISVRDDSATPYRGEKPPYIGGYVPDVYAIDVPTTKTLIGEAKTSKDLESRHSTDQISAFLDYLKCTPNGVFVLSVPLHAASTARRLVNQLADLVHNTTTKIIVLNGLNLGEGHKEC